MYCLLYVSNMATIKFYLDDRRRVASDTYVLKIVVRNRRSSCMRDAGIRLRREQWDAVAQCVVGHPMAAKYNIILRNKLNHLNTQLLAIGAEMNVNSVSASDLLALLEPEEAFNRERKSEYRGGLVSSLFDKFVGGKEKASTRETFVGTRNKISSFCKWDKLRFSDITYEWLKDFDSFMARDGNKVNTRSVHMRNVRTLFNEAIKLGIISQDKYPFRVFRIKNEDTEKRSLDVEQLRELRDYPVEEHMRKYVDMFFLSFYLAGINMVDLLNLPPLGKDGVLRYRRSKTGVLCELTMPEEARVIVDKYKGNERLLCFGEQYKNHKDFLHRMNENLGKVGDLYYGHILASNGARHKVKKYRSLFPGLTSYWARHTWATIAADIDISDAVIDAALGHRSPYKMTDIYVRRNAKKVDQAIRMVIDYVNAE